MFGRRSDRVRRGDTLRVTVVDRGSIGSRDAVVIRPASRGRGPIVRIDGRRVQLDRAAAGWADDWSTW